MINFNFKEILIILIITLLMGISFFLGIAYSETYYDNLILNELKENVINKNLTILDEKNIIGKWKSDYDLKSYSEYVQDNYFYSKNTTDCKFYSLNYILYLKKHNMDYKIITTENHIFIMTYNNSSYTILDGENIYRQNLKNS